MKDKDKAALDYLKSKIDGFSGAGMDKADCMRTAKAMGYEDDDGDEDDENGDDDDADLRRSMSAETVDTDALHKALNRIDAATRGPLAPAVDVDTLMAEANEAARIDATGLLKSLAQGITDTSAGLATSIDESAQITHAAAKMTQANALAVIQMNDRLAGIEAQIHALHGALSKSLGALGKSLALPEAPVSVQSRPVERFVQQIGAGAAQPEIITAKAAKAVLRKSLERAKAAGDRDTMHDLTNLFAEAETAGGRVPERVLAFVKTHRAA